MADFHSLLSYENPALDESDKEKESAVDAVKSAVCMVRERGGGIERRRRRNGGEGGKGGRMGLPWMGATRRRSRRWMQSRAQCAW